MSDNKQFTHTSLISRSASAHKLRDEARVQAKTLASKIALARKKIREGQDEIVDRELYRSIGARILSPRAEREIHEKKDARPFWRQVFAKTKAGEGSTL